jgi:hypothetical protein
VVVTIICKSDEVSFDWAALLVSLVMITKKKLILDRLVLERLVLERLSHLRLAAPACPGFVLLLLGPLSSRSFGVWSQHLQLAYGFKQLTIAVLQ